MGQCVLYQEIQTAVPISTKLGMVVVLKGEGSQPVYFYLKINKTDTNSWVCGNYILIFRDLQIDDSWFVYVGRQMWVGMLTQAGRSVHIGRQLQVGLQQQDRHTNESPLYHIWVWVNFFCPVFSSFLLTTFTCSLAHSVLFRINQSIKNKY